MTPPRAVLFDWDNTLVDTWTIIHRALRDTLLAMGHAPWSEAETRARVRHSIRESFPPLFGDRWREARKIFYRRYGVHGLEGPAPLAGAEGLLDAVAACAAMAGVISNKDGPAVRREVCALGWQDRFAAVVGAHDAPADKPDPAPVHLALAGSGIAAGGDVWLVGDTATDLECARRTGCRGILVGDADAGTRSAFDLRRGANMFATCGELAEFVRELHHPHMN